MDALYEMSGIALALVLIAVSLTMRCTSEFARDPRSTSSVGIQTEPVRVEPQLARGHPSVILHSDVPLVTTPTGDCVHIRGFCQYQNRNLRQYRPCTICFSQRQRLA